MTTPEQLLAAYENGYFPMAMAKDDPELYWFSPEERGVLPIAGFRVPHGLAKARKKLPYVVTVDRAFDAVIRSCGTLTPDRQETWINETIVGLYTALHRMGHAHSVEVWETVAGSQSPVASEATEPLAAGYRLPATLIGGLYGVSIGGAFFGESMFSRKPEASKIALVTLVEILAEAGYSLLDTQYVNDHLKQFGVEAVAKADYMDRLTVALSASPSPSTRFSTASVRRGLASASSARET